MLSTPGGYSDWQETEDLGMLAPGQVENLREAYVKECAQRSLSRWRKRGRGIDFLKVLLESIRLLPLQLFQVIGHFRSFALCGILGLLGHAISVIGVALPVDAIHTGRQTALAVL